jgi:ABC-2 type transport system ATP-binding protein
MAVIHVSGFRKTYGSTVAVDDVSFNVNAGEIFGLIGDDNLRETPNVSYRPRPTYICASRKKKEGL